MLVLKITEHKEFFDASNNEFKYIKPQTIEMEHSLISISKWEAKWKKPFLNTENKTREETIDYYRCMVINKDVDPYFYLGLDKSQINEIREYMDDSMTATTFSEDIGKDQNNGKTTRRKKEVITSELIYYWMISQNIPIEFQKWHINRLLTLIRVCGIKNQDPSKNKMSKRDIYSRNKALNEARKAKMGTHG